MKMGIGEVVMSVALFLVLIMIGVAMVDAFYKIPQAAQRANEICQEQGYDFYEKFERIGFLSKEPVAIKCKYVDNYKQIDMNLKQKEDYVVIEE